ncbi:hypothetical protein [Mycoplasma sp. CSL7503-lung]|uniref:hypothetical protein n=1 Tax=Mycoplasma sp. CSL7503-lung TaxID=536372 RepID=UPI0021D1D740|nr:hypothetical protein [Mycoplasma sp. CSL7503-lung]MCU4706471.1 hypothetical protein [Mycoplasma sp. CSL7503-lung]
MEKLKNKLKSFLSINTGILISISTISCSIDKKEIKKNIITNNQQKGDNQRKENNINTNVTLNKERDILGSEDKTKESKKVQESDSNITPKNKLNKNINYQPYEQHIKEVEKFLNLNQVKIKTFQIDINDLYIIIQKHKKSIADKTRNVQLLENNKNKLDKSINNIKQSILEGLDKRKEIDFINKSIRDIEDLKNEVERSGYAKATLFKLKELINKMKVKDKSFKNTFEELKQIKEKLITHKEELRSEYRSNLLDVQKELFLKYNTLKDKLNTATNQNDNKIKLNDEFKNELSNLRELNNQNYDILSNIIKVKQNINQINELIKLIDSIRNINLTTLQSLIERAKHAKMHSETHNIYHPLKARGKQIIENAEKIKECNLDSLMLDSNNKNELFSKIKNIINIYSSLNDFLEDYSLNAYYPEP